MANSVMQHAFHAGEWAPALNARVDLQKYRSAVALAENFFVDYRGGLSTRMGLKWVIQAYKPSTDVRLIPFQASAEVYYILEFGDGYVRFHTGGATVLESVKTITGITQANPAVVAVAAHGYSVGDWVAIGGVVGMTQVNSRYFRVNTVPDANHIGLGNILDNTNVNSSAYTAYSSGGAVARVYTLPSPYAAADLDELKFAQDVNTMVLCHPNYVPYVLTIISANNWTLSAIVFGSSVTAPAPSAATSAAGAANYSYIVTAVDVNGQESVPSSVATTTVANATGGTLTVSWSAVSGALSYNVYRAPFSFAGAVPAGTAFGFVINVTGVSFADSMLAGPVEVNPADFAQTIPVAKNPFQGAGVDHGTVTAAGSYAAGAAVPTITFTAAPAGGATATGNPALNWATLTPGAIGGGSPPWTVGELAYLFDASNVLWGIAVVATISGGGIGAITSFQPFTFPGSWSATVLSGTVPTITKAGNNPVFLSSSKSNVITASTWGVVSINMISHGSGYVATPSITFSSGAATATAVLEASAAGNPTVPGFFDQRLFLGAKPNSPQGFNMSQPGSSYNFNISNPLQADDAISGQIKGQTLNTIRHVIPMSAGLILMADRGAWLLNGGAAGAPVSAVDLAANAQSYNGIGQVPPIVANLDILYVQAKGSIVRDLTYNFYTNIYTGTDISVLSSHLFYGHQITEWAYAEEPFKLVQAIRDDGQMLSLTFMKEQELIGWTHYVTDGEFSSTASITEAVSFGFVDAVYVVVDRVINGVSTKYIERFVERLFENGVEDACCVDAAYTYSGSPQATFTNVQHLIGEEVTGLADGEVIPPFTVASTGFVTLSAPAAKLSLGKAYVCDFQTVQLDLGEPTVQGKRKKISGYTVRVSETLGLFAGRSFDNLKAMKDLIVGNVGSMTNEVVTDLVTGDARIIVDPLWDVPGQVCIRQSAPMPATILGVIPEITVGDTK